MGYGSHFVLGFDTFQRLLDLKYYEGSIDLLKAMLKELDNNGTRFCIGGRLNSKTSSFEELTDSSMEIVPPDFRHMFAPVRGFRLDLSSTELRARASKGESV